MITWVLKTLQLVEGDQILESFETKPQFQLKKVFTNHNKLLVIKPPEKDCHII